MSFPASPSDGDAYNEYRYNASIGAWDLREYQSLSNPTFYMNGRHYSGGEYTQVAVNGKSNGDFNVQSYTISMWAMMPTITNYGILWSYDYTSHAAQYYAQQLRILDDGAIYYSIGIDNESISTATGLVAANNWYHIVVTRTNGSTKIYIDKVVKASGTFSGTVTYYDQEVWIGKGNWDTTKELNVKHVRFYQRVLTTNEIGVLYDEFNKTKYIEKL